MRKTLIVITMGLMLTQTVTAQVFDDEKYLQWRSMETGPLGFAPKEYYWLFHNSYAHHKWEWEWHGLFHSGFYLNFKPNDSDAKPVVPKRTVGAATDVWTKESTDAQEESFKHQLEQETLAAADRRVDAAYLLFKDDFNNMQNKISNQNRFITEQVSYVHRSGNGYELENAKREECYIKLKADMEKVTQSTIDLMRYVEISR